MKDVFHILNELEHASGRNVLSTIIQVEGSAYRKEGAMLLVNEDGTQIGLLSGGCLERDLAEQAQRVLQEGTSRTIEYDMSAEDDRLWGQGSGCNGSIRVLLEVVDSPLAEHLKRLKKYLDEGISVLHVKKLSDTGSVTDYLFVTEHRQAFGKWDGAFPMQWDRSEGYFMQLFEPKPRLIIFGAGPDAVPLVRFAAHVGFSVTVTDWRPEFCNRTHFPDADDCRVGFPRSIVEHFSFSPRDSVIIMTHHFQRDREILQILLREKLNYIGVLGPRKRTSRLLGTEEIPNWIHSPVGLSIGAEGPEEIAISILADVIQTVRQRRKPHDYGNLFSSWAEQADGTSQTFPIGRRKKSG
ncbi:XdhC family protein [Desmospora profundinema]|uniref:Xanthine dehydrogenase accessory factor n=1 Tax=Desmospora profundinema TaxID=1571184 RepID=A0ABU1IPS8_9BACL|nr:XdhC family protein [Desmospora profundinema]MDR6226785.1 xanthine dehydrogenase accessory factor [Desmospora profundinema]